MTKPPFVPNDAECRAWLDTLDIAAPDPGPAVERSARLAARLLDAPVAWVTLADGPGRWIRYATRGAGAQLPGHFSSIADTVRQTGPLLVMDAGQDERIGAILAWPGGLPLSFVAGVPIKNSDGEPIGALCVARSGAPGMQPPDLGGLDELAGVLAQWAELRQMLGQARAHVGEAGRVALESIARITAIFDESSVGVALIGTDGCWLRTNITLSTMLGYGRDALDGRNITGFSHPEDLPSYLAVLDRLTAREAPQYEIEQRYRTAQGGYIWLKINISGRFDQHGNVEYYTTVYNDVSAQKAARACLERMHAELEQRVQTRTAELHDANERLAAALANQALTKESLRERTAELSNILEYASDVYVSLDDSGVVTAWNRQAELVLGWSHAEAIGRPLADLIVSADTASAYHEDIARFRRTGALAIANQRVEFPVRRKDGSTLTVEARANTLEVQGRRIISLFLHDITERKRMDAQRDYESRHDALTGLLNRRALGDSLPLAQARAHRNRQAMALLFIDLDGFKAVNDRWGHDGGDLLLKVIAERIAKSLRQSDAAFRLAGDEFTVILEGLVTGYQDAAAVARKLIDVISAPVPVPGGTAQAGASIGIGIFVPDSTDTADELVKKADECMYRAKHAGRGQIFPCPGAGDQNDPT
jgi:diguanylate cyclase (GGDEF)-like protein/PAS domain S-box-containing protein